jgi:hypothetical protein
LACKTWAEGPPVVKLLKTKDLPFGWHLRGDHCPGTPVRAVVRIERSLGVEAELGVPQAQGRASRTPKPSPARSRNARRSLMRARDRHATSLPWQRWGKVMDVKRSLAVFVVQDLRHHPRGPGPGDPRRVDRPNLRLLGAIPGVAGRRLQVGGTRSPATVAS